ncbi:hypothetical protein [Micromonospora pallida]|uniref:hypothetical protein n=1 Tax=Micromonospora pallida TaxID=145854 RepID=UPI00114CDA04|nr:hypothetical protein [Micromonospora pallida]
MSLEVDGPTLDRLERLVALLVDRTSKGAAQWRIRKTPLDSEPVFSLSTPNFTVHLRRSDRIGAPEIRIVDEEGNEVLDYLAGGIVTSADPRYMRINHDVDDLFAIVRKMTMRTARKLDRLIGDIEKL